MGDLFIDLAAGGSVLQASDEYLNPAGRLLEPADPVPDPGRPGARGAWLDGWETRRRREPGHEWAIIRMGRRGLLERLVVDTTHVTTSLPAACSVEAVDLPGDPGLVDLVRNRSLWREVVARTPVRGGGPHSFAGDHIPATHLRLVIYPDGGVARFRAYGDPLPPADLASRDRVDLASLDNGARVVAASDARTSSPNLMLLPGDPRHHRDGWITRRRREPGFEWAIIRLGGAGFPTQVTVDTRHFPGDSPDRVAVLGAVAGGRPPDGIADTDWRSILEPTEVTADSRNRFDLPAGTGPVTHLRLELHPDGAVARFRAHGTALGGWLDEDPSG